jgi:hypothetical protein
MKICLLVAAFAALAVPAVAAAPQKITSTHVGRVKLGATWKELHARHLLGPKVRGCEVAGRRQRGARLVKPLRGAVELRHGKVKSIEVTGGAKARGVGIGDRKADIVKAYPGVKFDHSAEDVFGVTLADVPKAEGGRLEFAIYKKTHRINAISVPAIAFCD